MNDAVKELARWPMGGFNRAVLCAYYALQRGRYRLAPAEPLQGRRILVLAPHVDDEVIGCGGYLGDLAKRGNEIQCIYMTDGAASDHPTLGRKEIARAREREGRQVASFFGFSPPLFLGEEDGLLAVEPPVVRRLQPLIQGFAPEILFLPCFLDGHRDHVATVGLGLQALARAGYPGDFPLYLYAVNSPLTHHTANCYFALREQWPQKKQALGIFASQTLPLEIFLTLDACRRHALPPAARRGAGGAEFFIRSTLQEYHRAFNLYGPEMYRNFRQISSPFNLMLHFFSGWPLKKEAAEHLGKKAGPGR